jgi:hypothetical protein
MSFVTLKDFSQLAMSRIARAHLDGNFVTLETDAGETFTAEHGAWEMAQTFGIQGVIAAPPGYFLLDVCGGEDGHSDYLDTEPIIGWAVNSSGRATPVTPGGVDNYDRATLRPDGKVQHNEGTYDSRESYAGLKGLAPFPPAPLIQIS